VLRSKEKRVVNFGAVFLAITLIPVALTNALYPLLIYIFPLILCSYVVLSLEGDLMLMFLGFIVLTVLALALLGSYGYEKWAGVISISLVPVIVLGSSWVGRLQFVRSCRPDLKSWPY
jgi:hypothetical protein